MDNDKTNAFVMKKMTFDMKFLEGSENNQANRKCPNQENLRFLIGNGLVVACNWP